MHIGEQLYLYLWSNDQDMNCNSVFIDGKVPVLIDPGWAHHVQSLLRRMSDDGVNPSKIKVILCTHGHPDHFEGTLAFKNRSVRIAISRLEEKFIEQVGTETYKSRGLELPDYRVDFYVKDGDLILGKHELKIFLTPGHSPGSVCIYWPRYKVLISGDLVFMGSVGRTDLPGGDGKQLLASIDKISQLPIEMIIPGHGPVIQGQQNVRRNFDLNRRALFGLV